MNYLSYTLRTDLPAALYTAISIALLAVFLKLKHKPNISIVLIFLSGISLGCATATRMQHIIFFLFICVYVIFLSFKRSSITQKSSAKSSQVLMMTLIPCALLLLYKTGAYGHLKNISQAPLIFLTLLITYLATMTLSLFCLATKRTLHNAVSTTALLFSGLFSGFFLLCLIGRLNDGYTQRAIEIAFELFRGKTSVHYAALNNAGAMGIMKNTLMYLDYFSFRVPLMCLLLYSLYKSLIHKKLGRELITSLPFWTCGFILAAASSMRNFSNRYLVLSEIAFTMAATLLLFPVDTSHSTPKRATKFFLNGGLLVLVVPLFSLIAQNLVGQKPIRSHLISNFFESNAKTKTKYKPPLATFPGVLIRSKVPELFSKKYHTLEAAKLRIFCDPTINGVQQGVLYKNRDKSNCSN